MTLIENKNVQNNIGTNVCGDCTNDSYPVNGRDGEQCSHLGGPSYTNDGQATKDIDSRRDDNDCSSINYNIYRYKFTQEFMDNLYQFSKIHQYDDRHVFKESWEKWTEDNSIMIMDEIERLESLEYRGDILDKMFKSARYYYRKKGTEKKAPATRRAYISLQKSLLDAIDTHIINSIKMLDTMDFKPSVGFVDFCENNKDVLREAVQDLMSQNMKNAEEIEKKVKKTYKNRYFMKTQK
jgi:hypothetical protein